MDMKRFRRPPSSPPPDECLLDSEEAGAAIGAASPAAAASGGRRPGSMVFRLAGFLLACLIALPSLLLLSGVYFLQRQPHPQPQQNWTLGLAERADLEGRSGGSNDDDFLSSSDVLKNKLLGGLLVTGFDEESCLSRYQSILLRKASPYKPSPHLLEILRKYETLHKTCGPYTQMYNKSLEQMKSGQNTGTAECKYVVWISYSGLGNRILTLASAFLYALVTGRVLLVDRGTDIDDLFCEPFLESTWLLPLDFPLNQFKSFNEKSPHSYGNMLKNKSIDNSMGGVVAGLLPSFIYLHLAHDYDDFDKLFFCEQDQLLLKKIPWMVLRTDNYFVPSLFLIPMFEEDLSRLFPEKDTVFHHLGRYLFHPTNSVWGLISRYYQAYLAKSGERVGIQIRVFDTGISPFQHVLDQILACTLREKLLPDVNRQEPTHSAVSGQSKSVLVTSLSSGYFEKIRDMYWEHSTMNGEVISISQPSHEGYQQTEKHMHNMKAWAEMYLLSLTDVLVTSSWSTFGYVAQGLGGLKPWILFKPENHTAPDPPCRQAMSMEPCFHAPPFYDCKAKRGVDTGELVPYVRHCEDMSWGLKLVNKDEW